MADDKLLDVLSDRLEKIEALVFGVQEKDAQYPKCIDSMSKVNTHLATMAAGRDKVNEAFKRVNELEQCLDTDAVDDLTVAPSVKADIIITEEESIKQRASDLETLQRLSHVLDSEHIKAVPGLSDQLQLLGQKQLEEQDKTAVLTDDVKRLLSAYNNIVVSMSKQFVKWDEMLTKLELAQQGPDTGHQAVYPSL